MGEEGQMILLSALAACLCLLGVAACIAAIDGTSHMEAGRLSDGGMDNVRWAQDCALQRAALYGSAYPWECRADAALKFKSDADTSMDSLAGELLRHGTIYRFSLNGSLADDYVASNPGNGTLNIDGVLVEHEGGRARICGCAYDAFAYDGVTAYRESRVLTFD
ncbi:hypothetical protein Mtc_0037 [Methanocella conradii HZ254]|uniref:Uncharacterized protein n=1 Tax=Methanocella conradii (strain DSM 24694 / JCM 17849 / CGMCC 1.5162 / HZ254) TaxID=1041930 RepID=H8I5B8_METCZ|nr:hypothetical protein [Methanocella conradii]AFC98812.1 hypothetical protein Mtc_0037 [Methanocella conradii HZ254]MDI6897136.1 hypothetical protein [Methanocella conradii]